LRELIKFKLLADS